MRQYRQGDVFVEKILALPEGCNRVPGVGGRIILALGEATGHAHAIAVEDDVALLEKGDERFLEVKSPAVLRHEEHSAVVIEPGVYRVVRQREYSKIDEYRTVSD